ncbi:capsid scaffolding serine peptidase GPO [Pseudomonas tolaasii NCPPB 2192]|uniref:Capsid scaffolding serine peptidase GPO n=1 Tax=Pseudomonas tolaasii NCPPB 2192 TaxID=564423 RepID=A0ABX4QHS3_PSETO|nr:MULTISPECIES: GPO family capsid scaffolding protein [Pseudomonas]ARB31509.1 phage capsid protein [Pseudomonas tolaasii]KAB0477689.1 GPO family capsid scaffolding protein [Pseudomonas tolaasii]PKA76225.1 capsid scaffolding serine peptidase GPO [Pseudomonas tolaasii NCPPB 2192]TSD78241.1 GPO family capsid scaffolding protein [Pseudomonas sp. KBS0710]
MASSTKQKFRSKWTRIAVEGATTDGRIIERSWIDDMASQYSQNTYGARINCEHIKGYWPGGEFGAYGDVVALKAEEVDIAGIKKLALFAQLEPNDALLALNKAGQKVYTSVEIQPKFADSGKAYLVGLAITDTPASLGTEALSFSATHGTLAGRKQDKDNLFSAAEEASLEFEEVTDQPSAFAAIKAKLGEFIKMSKDKDGKDANTFSDIGEALESLVTLATQQAEQADASSKALVDLKKQFTSLDTELKELKTKLGQTADLSQPQRPHSTGGAGTVLTAY